MPSRPYAHGISPAEAFRFSFQSRMACLVTLCASAVAFWYAVMQASAFVQIMHSS